MPFTSPDIAWIQVPISREMDDKIKEYMHSHKTTKKDLVIKAINELLEKKG